MAEHKLDHGNNRGWRGDAGRGIMCGLWCRKADGADAAQGARAATDDSLAGTQAIPRPQLPPAPA